MHELSTFHFNATTIQFELEKTSKNVGANDVLIKTTHSGICYTDVHAKSKGCGLGHEGVGVVQEVGSAVKHLKEGDRVGGGWLHSCAEASGFAFPDLDQGAFGDLRIIDSTFAYRIPDTISSVDAGPFMCAGASVYEALDAAGTKASDEVAVFGLGGLGHMGVLFAKAMGCRTLVISSGDKKKEDAFKLGANEFRSLDDIEFACTPSNIEGKLEAQPMRANVLLITSNEVPDLRILLPLLARRATIVLMTIQQNALSLPYMPFILPGHRLIASTEASRENHINMLTFAARHNIKPWVEEFPMTSDGLTQAFARLEAGEMRFRGVLVR